MREPDDNAGAISWLLDHSQPSLTTWELDFLNDIQDRPRLTPKQQAKLDAIWREVVVDKRR